MSRFFLGYKSVLLGVAVCGLLAGCAKEKMPVASQSVSQVSLLKDLPPPTRADMQSTGRPYLIGPFDKLRIEVFGVQDLQRDIQADAEASFAFPLVGRVDASGRSPTEIAREIEQRLDTRFVRNPQVSVNLISTVTQQVTIDGQVGKPGQYPVMGTMTLMRSVALAGGLNEFADLEDVLIFRDVDRKRYVGIYNLEAIRRGNYADPEVFPNDVIVVGDSKQRRMFKDILQAAPLLTTPIIVIANQL